MGRLCVLGRRVAASRLYVLGRHVKAEQLYVPVRPDRLYAPVRLCVLGQLAVCGVYVSLRHVRRGEAKRLCVLRWRVVVVARRPHDPCSGSASWRTGRTYPGGATWWTGAAMCSTMPLRRSRHPCDQRWLLRSSWLCD